MSGQHVRPTSALSTLRWGGERVVSLLPASAAEAAAAAAVTAAAAAAAAAAAVTAAVAAARTRLVIW